MQQLSRVKDDEVLDLIPEPPVVVVDDSVLSPGLLSPVTNGRVWVPAPRKVRDRPGSWSDRSLRVHAFCSRLCKRTFDVVVSALLLILLAPLFVLIAVAIKLTSPG